MGMGRAASNPKLLAWCQENGMFDPKLGRPSNMGPTWAMWRYAVANPKEAWPSYKGWAMEHMDELVANGINLSFGLFLQDLKRHAQNPAILGKTSYDKWCREWEPYINGTKTLENGGD